MEIDYHQVLGVCKSCSKEDITKAYLHLALQNDISRDEHELYTRALLVLRVRYLTYVHQRRGEAGLEECRSDVLLARGSKAINQALRSRLRAAINVHETSIPAADVTARCETSSDASGISMSLDSFSSITSPRDEVVRWLEATWREPPMDAFENIFDNTVHIR